MAPLLIAGTVPRVGKTRVGTALARALADRGAPVLALKPIETGCRGPTPGVFEDGVQLARATGQAAPRAALCRLAADLPAPLAAEMGGGSIGWDTLVQAALAANADHDVVLLEGLDGLLAPVTWTETTLDLAVALGASVILVVADERGALAQAQQGVRLCAQAGVPVAAIVFNQRTAPGPRDPSVGLNAAAARNLDGLPPLYTVPHVDTLGAAAHALAPLAQALLSARRAAPPRAAP